jgi:hypothetical protein
MQLGLFCAALLSGNTIGISLGQQTIANQLLE